MAVTQTWTEPSTYDKSAGDIITEAIWDGVVSDILYNGRAIEPKLTNNSGGALTAGAVVICDTSADSYFTTTTAIDSPLVLGVLMESAANGATGRIATRGAVSVLVQGNVTRGQYLRTSSTAGRAEGTSYLTPGCFAVALTAYGDGGAGSVTGIMITLGPGSTQIISDTVLTGSAASVDLQAIPQTFRHLKLIYSLRTDRNDTNDNIAMRINNDSNSSYVSTQLIVTPATSAASGNTSAATTGLVGIAAGATTHANTFAPGFMDFLNYTISEQTKQVQGVGSYATAANAPRLVTFSSHYITAGAISRITLLPAAGTNFVAGSRVTLYAWR